MSFMEPEVYEGRVYQLEDASDGSVWYVPVVDVDGHIRDCVPSGDLGCEPILHEHMVIGRLITPGYLDCTDWEPYDSVEAAEAALAEELGEDEDEDDTFDDED